MDGWRHRWRDDGWMDGWTDGWMDGVSGLKVFGSGNVHLKPLGIFYEFYVGK